MKYKVGSTKKKGCLSFASRWFDFPLSPKIYINEKKFIYLAENNNIKMYEEPNIDIDKPRYIWIPNQFLKQKETK